MDVSRYNFICQKALHQGLQYAKSFGHVFLEVEHVALALLKADCVELKESNSHHLQEILKSKLSEMQKVFGNVSIKFGIRLDKALDLAESQSTDIVDEEILWKSLVKQSTILKTSLAVLDSAENKDKSNLDDNRHFSESVNKSIEGNNEKSPESNVYKIPEKYERVLKSYTIDLTSLAEQGELDPVLGRDTETRRTLEILGRKKKNNPILIGEAGVGKTSIAEAIALRIAEGRVPETMKGKRVLSLDLGSVIAGSKFRGEFEGRVKDILEAIKSCEGGVILFIDEIHMIVGAGNSDGSVDAANLLKPALARGSLRCLGATTLDEYRQFIEKDPALQRRFQEVMVLEPDRSSAISILRGLKEHYEIYHSVQINDDALVSAVDLSIRYLPNARLPDKAIDLLDEACSRLRMQIDSLPSVMDELKSRINQAEIEKKAIEEDTTAKTSVFKLEVSLENLRKKYDEFDQIWRNHKALLESLTKYEKRKHEFETLFESSKSGGEFEFAAKLQYQEIPKVQKKMQEIKDDLNTLQDQFSWLRQIVGNIEIAEVVASWTRVPVNKILKSDSGSLDGMRKRLGERIFGQNEALDVLCKAIKRSRAGVNDPTKPIGVFLFLGPTGVGKTETAKAIALELFDDENKMVRIDMSEYMEQHNVSRLIGAPPGYVGYDEGGGLTEPVRRSPYTVILFDEIEKAHPKALDLLLQLFDDGRLTDGKGRSIDFKNTLIILTSNVQIQASSTYSSDSYELEKRNQLANHFRPEFVGRIDEVVVFNGLGTKHFTFILDKLLKELNDRLQNRQFKVFLGERLRKSLSERVLGGKFGGRAMKRTFQHLVVDKVSERILADPKSCTGAWKLEYSDDGKTIWTLDDSVHRYLMPASQQNSK